MCYLFVLLVCVCLNFFNKKKDYILYKKNIRNYSNFMTIYKSPRVNLNPAVRIAPDQYTLFEVNIPSCGTRTLEPRPIKIVFYNRFTILI